MFPHIYRHLAYDSFRDVAPVRSVAASGMALVIGALVPRPVETLSMFIEWVKAHPSSGTCGNAGSGSFLHFVAVLLARDANLPLIHVAYRGGFAAVQAVASGQNAAAIVTEGTANCLHGERGLRVLATTGSGRSPLLPNVPTFGELGYEKLARAEWFGALMRSGAAQALITTACTSLRRVLAVPRVRAVFGSAGLSVQPSSPDELHERLRRDYELWGPVIKASGFSGAV